MELQTSPCGEIKTVPKFTSSIDAALTTIPYGGKIWSIDVSGIAYVCDLDLPRFIARGRHASIPHAIIIASLEAIKEGIRE